MTNLDQALNEAEGAMGNTSEMYSEGPFDICVQNGNGGAKREMAVLPDNTLEQVLQDSAKELGIDTKAENIIFFNDRTKESVTDLNTTIREFQVQPKDVIVANPDGKVAAK